MVEQMRWLTISQVADWLNVSEPTIRNWINSGVFPIYRPNPRGKIFILESDVVDAMRSRRLMPRSWGLGEI